MSHADDTPGIPSRLLEVPDTERRLHRQLVLRHIDFLVKLLAADQELQPWAPATACPDSTPERVARKRGDEDKFPCLYTTIARYEESPGPRVDTKVESACRCNDPLAESDDPLDAVAAISLATSDRSIAARYVNRRWRAVVADLRKKYGTWSEISNLPESELANAVESARGTAVSSDRVSRLCNLIARIEEDDRFKGVSLRDLPPRPYSSFHGLLSSFPGVSERDAWWLLLTAFDKPVWPTDPDMDRLLCDLGLLPPDRVGDGERHETLEEELVDRQIPALHRALAGHAARGQRHFATEDCELRKFSLIYRARQQARQNDHHDRPVAVDMFAGAGGISHGLLRAGYDIALAVDNNRHATDSYRLNHPQLPHSRIRCTDIEDLLEREDWPDLLPENPDIMVGGPPCQSLSLAGYRSRRADDSDYSIRDDPRTELYTRYLDAVRDLQPKALVIENVEGMANEIEDTEERVVDQILDDLESGGDGETAYVADFRTIDCSEYGIPQERNRIIIFGVREDLVKDGPTPDSFFEALGRRSIGEDEDPYSLKQGLAGLPRLKRDEGGDIVLGKPWGPLGDYVDEHDLSTDTNLSFNHRAREHPMEKDQELFEIMDPGDTGWYIKYKKKGGKWSHLIEYNVGTEDNPAFTDKYRMIHWEDPAPTVVAHLAKDANNYIIPDYYEYANPDEDRQDPARNRGVTPREAARLQSFPDDYIFLGPFTSQFRQIGNAVPPVLGWHLGIVLQETVLAAASTRPIESTSTGRQVVSSDD